ncbi:hypothetical protein GBA65_19020 [Rubrobacter marinus]|uniref:NurA domain-containing protein n=1 Tax=Rubrobacter marinus TaxID=2653852 RepID=A0A6G8Q1A4_9ACTN|nr:hypothetical protein [Rubrobacter marinus]QIN80264.1 hypothetical protein GBA65_19020 [Rubrobacter marinus]
MRDFAARIDRALSSARKHGVRFSAGAGAGDMEMQGLGKGTEDEGLPVGGPDHLEGRPGWRDPGVPDGSSKLCYFLDGVQSTREIGRIGAVPIVVTTVAATIINRCDRRFSRVGIEEGPPVVVRAVILPNSIGDEKVAALWEALTSSGLVGLEPGEDPHHPDLLLDSTEYAANPDPSDYVGLRESAMVRVRTLRERLETALLRRWETDDRVLGGDDWIAVDGQLRDIKESNRRAVGLIKSVARPEFTGEEIGVLLDLEPGMRTTSFVPGWQRELPPNERRTSWYMRMWPPQSGADALGSLMRVEAQRGTSAEEVDEISRWILAEKAPLAKPDSRWPAMIYPIQYVEKVLKPTVQGSERAFARLERGLAANGGN